MKVRCCVTSLFENLLVVGFAFVHDPVELITTGSLYQRVITPWAGFEDRVVRDKAEGKYANAAMPRHDDLWGSRHTHQVCPKCPK